MIPPRTIGLPRMKHESGEKRVFLPEFVQFLTRLRAQVFLEDGYGSRSGYSFQNFKRANPSIYRCSREEVFQKDVVLVLRSPAMEEYELIKPGSILLSMLHFPTRPLRVNKLVEHNIKGLSLDSIVNDNNVRLVENMKAVAWNGLEAAFDVLEKRWPGLERPDGIPIQVLILGTGMVGKHAVDAATKLGNVERNNEHMAAGGNGTVALSVGRNAAGNPRIMEALFKTADVVVDATQRYNASEPVIPNEWIAWLPEHSVIVDLAVDPYTLETDPPVVRGVEGIPQGNLDQFVFFPDDPNWDATVPSSIPSSHRRTTVSCYSWPGIHAEACMAHYGEQLEPLMEILFEKGYESLSLNGGYFERALYRGTLKARLEVMRHEADIISASRETD